VAQKAGSGVQANAEDKKLPGFEAAAVDIERNEVVVGPSVETFNQEDGFIADPDLIEQMGDRLSVLDNDSERLGGLDLEFE